MASTLQHVKGSRAVPCSWHNCHTSSPHDGLLVALLRINRMETHKFLALLPSRNKSCKLLWRWIFDESVYVIESEEEKTKLQSTRCLPSKWRDGQWSESSRGEAAAKNILINDLASYSATITSWLRVEAFWGEDGKKYRATGMFVTLYWRHEAAKWEEKERKKNCHGVLGTWRAMCEN